jgi:hypothetical protein
MKMIAANLDNVKISCYDLLSTSGEALKFSYVLQDREVQRSVRFGA